MIRALIVDDEEPARELLRAFLARTGKVDVVGEAGNGDDALRLLDATRADAVFLDVQMPGMSGLDVAARFAARDLPPLVVFVTAYDRYAIEAFELSAADYLLKPFDSARLNVAVDRLSHRLENAPAAARDLRVLIDRLLPSSQRQVVLKTNGRHLFVEPREIEWIESDGKDARVHFASSTAPVVVRESLAGLVERLDPGTFVRVHRSAVVNRHHVREVQPWFKGDFVIVLRRGARVTSGRTYRDTVLRLIG
jgi:two-component system, LytTR family, response regulator